MLHFVQFWTGSLALPLKRKIPANYLETWGQSFVSSTSRGNLNDDLHSSQSLDAQWSSIYADRPPILHTYSRRRRAVLPIAALLYPGATLESVVPISG